MSGGSEYNPSPYKEQEEYEKRNQLWIDAGGSMEGMSSWSPMMQKGPESNRQMWARASTPGAKMMPGSEYSTPRESLASAPSGYGKWGPDMLSTKGTVDSGGKPLGKITDYDTTTFNPYTTPKQTGPVFTTDWSNPIFTPALNTNPPGPMTPSSLNPPTNGKGSNNARSKQSFKFKF